MKTIKIFLASSEELEDDRNAFGNLVRKLNKTYEKRGIHLELFEWEDYDAAYNDRRKQDEYNNVIPMCDIFIALFHTRVGTFTLAEVEMAIENYHKNGSPKTYIYFKKTKDEEENQSILSLKESMITNYGYYPITYSCFELFALHFVLQLQCLNNIEPPFIANNDDYQKMSARLAELPAKIEKARSMSEKYPDDEDFIDNLQTLLNEYNKLKEDIAEYQNHLYATAKHITQLQGVPTDRRRRAMELFLEGRVREANIILEEAEFDSESVFKKYKQSKELIEQKRQNAIKSIEEILLKASATIANSSIPVEERIAETEVLYARADAMAQECAYDKEEYRKLLAEYTKFLREHAKSDKAIALEQRLLKLYDPEHPNTATSYNNIGSVFHNKGDYDKALEYYFKALAIFEKVLGVEHPNTAASYYNIGNVYSDKGDYDRALEYHFKALAIREKILGKEHPDTASSYNSIGNVYYDISDYDKALEYYFKALAIFEKVLSVEHPNTAASYYNIGNIYSDKGDYDGALEYHFKALAIREKILGKEHPDTATSYNNIGNVYSDKGDYDKALEYYLKALNICENTLGKNHPLTISCHKNISTAHTALGNTDAAKKQYTNTNELDSESRVYISSCVADIEKAKQYATAITNCGYQPILNVPSIKIDDCAIFVSLVSEKFSKEELFRKDFDKAFELGKKMIIIQIEEFNIDPRCSHFAVNWSDIENYQTLETKIADILATKTGMVAITKEQRERNAEADFEQYEPQKNDTDIFISYRRKDGHLYARIVELALKLNGYQNVFMDYTSLKDGYFNNHILDSIYSCKDFILIATDDACGAVKKGTSISKDWVAKEIRAAVKHNKHIVPLIIEDKFTKWPEELSDDGKIVRKNQERKLKIDEYFDDSIIKIISYLASQPNKITPAQHEDSPTIYKVKVNKNANLFIDDEMTTTLEANKLVKIPLKQGGYFRRIEAMDDCTNFVEDTIEIYNDKAEFIKLS